MMLALTKLQVSTPGGLCVKTGVASGPTEEEKPHFFTPQFIVWAKAGWFDGSEVWDQRVNWYP